MLKKAVNKVRKEKKGFTLAELLIVVAIIAVLAAISIPIFTSQLEKSREATDISNIRAAYAEIASAALTDPDTDHTTTVTLKQTKADWQTDKKTEIAGVKLSDIGDRSTIKKDGSVEIKYTATDAGSGNITIGKAAVPSSKIDNGNETNTEKN